MLGVAALSSCGDNAPKVSSTSSSSSTSTSISEDTTSTAAPAPSSTARSTSSTARPVTATTLLAAERKCTTVIGTSTTNTTWQNYYSSDPGANQPATLTACIDDIHPKAGHMASLTITAKDPDATIPSGDECAVFVDWESDRGNLCYDVLMPPPTGPKPAPPARQAGSVDKTVTHTYAKAGDYTVTVELTTGGDPYGNPYSSRAKVTIAVHVRG